MKRFRCLPVLIILTVTLGSPAAFAVRSGTPTDNQAFPNVVELRKDNPKGGFMAGTGVLISPDIILTAAHVVKKWDSSSTQYIFWNGQRLKIAGVVLNPYLHDKDNIDMAVVRLAAPISAPPAPFYTGRLSPGEALTIVGFGHDGNMAEPNSGIGKMHMGTATVTSYISTPKFADGKIKTGRGPAGNIACEGDSGGPAFINGQLVGTFFGFVWKGNPRNECDATVENTYVNVSVFIDWINQAIAQLNGQPLSQQSRNRPAPVANAAAPVAVAGGPAPGEDVVISLAGERIEIGLIDADIQQHQSAHPEIAKAMLALREAHEALSKAAHDYDGHRVQALRLVDSTLVDLHKAVAFADSHPT